MDNIGMIWDFDGVLVFTPHEEAWRKAAEHYGAYEFDHEFYVKYVSGKPRYDGADNILKLLGIYEKFNATDDEERQKLLHEFADFKNKLVNEMFERGDYGVNMDAIRFLIESKKHGIKHALASASKNATKLSERIKVHVGNQIVSLYSLFDVNVSGKASSKEAVFKLAVEELKTMFPNLKYFIVIEDSPTGIKAAKKLGLFTLGYERETKLDADLRFKDFNEFNLNAILNILERGVDE